MRIVRRADRPGPTPGIPQGYSVRDMQAARGTPLTGQAAAREAGPPDRPAQPPDTRTAPRRVRVLVCIALTVLAVDIATKVTVVAVLSDRAPVALIGGLLQLGVWRNP